VEVIVERFLKKKSGKGLIKYEKYNESEKELRSHGKDFSEMGVLFYFCIFTLLNP